ncbi:MAG: DUF1997 domain-containing protein [Oculatellaceae cyanobacterium Prado106]|jgi:hypothetical protein|nr:DUF1997 domain-containing protein [Oculatellaceae cyanobacterium Prado106]
MQANSAEHDSLETSSIVFGATSGMVEESALEHEEFAQQSAQPTCFHGHFSSCMEMYATPQQVLEYLDAHRSWFPRCANPMKALPIGENGYDLTVGKFGSFGYDVEAKIGLDLLPQNNGVYRIETIPIPGYQPPGYDVDFQAELHLVDATTDHPLTQVEWELNLQVTIQFPRFINKLPKSLVQSTGDRLLNQIVRQVSRCLTHKVQEDFHKAAGLPFPKKRWSKSWHKNEAV